MDDLNQFLGCEGFSEAEMRQLHGRVMQKQLLARMAAAKAAKGPAFNSSSASTTLLGMAPALAGMPCSRVAAASPPARGFAVQGEY